MNISPHPPLSVCEAAPLLQADFEQFDRNASGFLEGREIRMLLAKQLSLTGPATKRQLDSFLAECDVDKDGRIRCLPSTVCSLTGDCSFAEYLDVMLGRCWRLIGQGAYSQLRARRCCAFRSKLNHTAKRATTLQQLTVDTWLCLSAVPCLGCSSVPAAAAVGLRLLVYVLSFRCLFA